MMLANPLRSPRAPALLAAAMLFAAAAPVAAQGAPRFDAYPAARAYAGPARPVDFGSHKAARALRPDLRAVIRDEVAKGPNFAGRFRLVTVGCGTACQAVFAIDLRTGRMYATPKPATAGVAFRRGSRLVRLNADPAHDMAALYYVFRDGRFRPVQ